MNEKHSTFTNKSELHPSTLRPHDAFFKRWLGDPNEVADLITHFFPIEISQRIDISTLERQPESFVSPDLRQSHSDLLYQVKQRDGAQNSLYILFEHKSAPEKSTVLQLLRYIVEIWQKQWDEAATIYPVISLVFYHGPNKWGYPNDLHSLLQPIAKEIRQYVPQFEYILIDLNRYEIEHIKGSVINTLALRLLKAVAMKEPDETILRLANLMVKSTEKNTEFLHSLLTYLYEHNIQPETYGKLNQKLAKKGLTMPTLKERFREEGREECREEIARNMKNANLTIEDIAKLTGFSPERIANL